MVQAAHAYAQRHGPVEVAASAEPASREDVASPEQIAAGVVDLRARWESPTELRVRANILDTFHINAHEPSAGLVPTVLSVVEAPNATVDYPPGEERRFAFADEPNRVYDGSVMFVVRFATPPSGERITVRLTYQACDDSTCLPPITKQFHLPSSST